MLDFENISDFFIVGEFAQWVEVEGGYPIVAIYNDGFVGFNTGMGLEGSNSGPSIMVKAVDAETIVAGMTPTIVVINYKRYAVTDKRADMTQKIFVCTLQEIA